MRVESCLLGYYSEIFLKRNFTPIKSTTPEFSDHYYKNLIGGHIPSRYRSKYNFDFSKTWREKCVPNCMYIQTEHYFVQYCKDIYKQIRGLEGLTTINHISTQNRSV